MLAFMSNSRGRSAADHATRTLWLCGLLHGFTHLYNVALVPLYLLIQADFGLGSVEGATLLLTAMMVAYFAPSYPMGVLADRCSRKTLLGVGLAINSLAFIALAFAPSYYVALGCVVTAGLGGSFYHPAATALIAELYPKTTGRALGLVGMGSGAGFFLGPLYAGWRAQAAGWRAPVLELGVAGLVATGVFMWLAEERPRAQETATRSVHGLFPTKAVWISFFAAGLLLSLRDFAGGSVISLSSLFLQNAHGFGVKATGLALGALYIASLVSNPLFGHLSDRGRKRWTATVLLIAALVVALLPRVPAALTVPLLVVYGFFLLASYPMTEAAVMVAVPDAVRGRVFGLFITMGGLLGNLAHWQAGRWVSNMGDGANNAARYYGIYTLLAFMILLSIIALPCLDRIRTRGRVRSEPSPKMSPATSTVAGAG